MVFVYVIESVTDKTWYTGIALDPVKRWKEHNAGKKQLFIRDCKWQGWFSVYPENIFVNVFYGTCLN